MTIGKVSALIAGFIGAVALGVAIGPSVREAYEPTPPVTTQAPDTTTPPQAHAPEARVAKRAAPAMPSVAAVPASEPELHARLKPVLNRGTRMADAAEGFRDAEQFATVAHASRNTKVPFMVLKHHVLDEGQSLAQVIREYKPELDAKKEVTRARTAARADVAAIAG